MEDSLKEQIQKSLSMYCKVKGMNDSELARHLTVSPTLISNIKTGKFDKISEHMLRSISNKINPTILAGLVKTNDCNSVFNGLEMAKKERLMIGITGDTGFGKTTSCKAYSLREEVFYYEYEFGHSPKNFLKAILQAMSISFEGTIPAMLDRLCDEINFMESPLIIVDEVSKCNEKMIMLLHSLRNKTQHNCGIALVGMPYFRNNLIKQIGKGTIGYAEFFRRINIFHELKGLLPDEINFILDANGITNKDTQREFRKYTQYGTLDNEIRKYKLVNS